MDNAETAKTFDFDEKAEEMAELAYGETVLCSDHMDHEVEILMN